MSTRRDGDDTRRTVEVTVAVELITPGPGGGDMTGVFLADDDVAAGDEHEWICAVRVRDGFAEAHPATREQCGELTAALAEAFVKALNLALAGVTAPGGAS